MGKNVIILLMALLLTMQCFAVQTDENRTLTKVAVQPEDEGYFRLAEGITLPCKHSVVYFDIASPSGKGYLSLILAAKMAEKKVTITYEQGADTRCSLTHVTIL